MASVNSPKPTLDQLLDDVQKGVTVGAAKEYLDKYLWTKIWSIITLISNAPPEMPILLQLKGELRAHLLLAQELKLDLADAEYAVAKLRGVYGEKQNKEVT